ncbi:MAG: hypothetical protein LKI39_05395 [Bacteroides sp.]|jgi:hypothetical protein|nr:hypothetical protein [Bacteroides sp.]MCI1681972.1 hypothetical protein [Bacteroides sp.]
METHPLFSRTIEAYSAYLRDSSVKHITFQSFCRKYHVDGKGIRHGISLETILYEIHLFHAGGEDHQVLCREWF